MACSTEAERNEARETLLSILKPGQFVYTILRHVSASGMSRRISLAVVEAGEITPIDYYVSKLCGYTRDPKAQGLKISGCGMDMGFEMVYQLGEALWPNGTDAPHGTRNGAPDSAGGYALKHRWL